MKLGPDKSTLISYLSVKDLLLMAINSQLTIFQHGLLSSSILAGIIILLTA